MTKTTLIKAVKDALGKYKDVMLVLDIRGRGLSAQRISQNTDLERKFKDYNENLELKTDDKIYFKSWRVKGW